MSIRAVRMFGSSRRGLTLTVLHNADMVCSITVLYNGFRAEEPVRTDPAAGRPAAGAATRTRRGHRDQKGVIAMAVPIGPAGRRPPTHLRVISGFDVLERWSEQATQVEKNIV